MYFLCAVAVGILLHKHWPTLMKAIPTALHRRGASKQPPDWLRRWWTTKNLDVQDQSTPEEYRHYLHLTLRTCTVGLTLRTEKATQDLNARAFFPASIPDNRFQPVLELMEEFHDVSGPFTLQLEKNHGTLWLHTFVDGATIIRMTDEERQMVLHEFFNRIDQIFPEVMKVIYGFNMPALAVMKMAGMKQRQLN